MEETVTNQFKLGQIDVDVVLKDIRNIHLGVYPPNGRVRVAAPTGTNMDSRAHTASGRERGIHTWRRRCRTRRCSGSPPSHA